jgi:LacI family transcriptional regulator
VLARGHREIAYIGGPPDNAATGAREEGFRAALADAGVPVREHWMYNGGPEIGDGYRSAVRLLDHTDRPTALVCWNDRLAAGALLAILERGLRVPDDISVVGYDDQEGLADQLSPALTTVSIPHYEMGRAAVEAVMTALAANRPVRGRQVPGRLIRRASLGSVTPST